MCFPALLSMYNFPSYSFPRRTYEFNRGYLYSGMYMLAQNHRRLRAQYNVARDEVGYARVYFLKYSEGMGTCRDGRRPLPNETRLRF